MPFTKSMLRARFVLSAALLYGCASASATAREGAQPPNPLAGMLGRQLLVLPAQFLAVANAGGTWDVAPEGGNLLPIIDGEIEDAFRKRGVRGNWTFANQIVQSASRNGGLVGDPIDLHATGIRRVKAGDTPLPESLASDIRKLVALTSARYVLLPIEVHVDTRNDARTGSLRVLLIDARTARVTWVGDVEAPPDRDPLAVSETLSPYGFRRLSRVLAMKLADMVVPE